MVRTYKRKQGARNYRTYSDAQLSEAVEKIRSREISLRGASIAYNIPRGTLSNRLNKRHQNVPGHPTVFSVAEEKSLIAHITAVSDWGFPFTILDMRFLAKCYLDTSAKTVTCFKQNFPSAEWARSFLKRHAGHLRHRLCQNIKKARAEVSPETVNSYFDNLEQSLKNDDGTQAEAACIFNYDETNLTDDPGVKKCVFRRGVKYPERVCDHTKSSISVMFCGSADGTILPPYVVYKAENLWDRWMEGGPKGARYNRSKSGWFDSTTFGDWFETIFLPHTRRLGKVFLIGDNLASHFTERVVRSAAENNVSFICLPKNATHLCQPLDVAFYRPLKGSWRKVLDNWKTTGVATKSKTVTKEAFPGLLKELCINVCSGTGHGDTLTSEALIAGFRKCGIMPLNRNEVLSRLPKSYNDQNAAVPVSSPTKRVSDSVLIVLKTMRYGEDKSPKARKKRSRIDVEPGRSISWDELQGDQISGTGTGTGTNDVNEPVAGSSGIVTDTVKRTCSSAKTVQKRRRIGVTTGTNTRKHIGTGSKKLLENDSDESSGSDAGDSSIEDQMDIASVMSDVEFDVITSTSTGNTESNLQSHTAKLPASLPVLDDPDSSDTSTSTGINSGTGMDVTVGHYAVIKFEAGRHFRFYVGEILNVQVGNSDTELEVSCLRCTKLLNHFRMPNVPDVSLISKSQVYALLPKPKPGRRGLMLFQNLQDNYPDINIE